MTTPAATTTTAPTFTILQGPQLLPEDMPVHLQLRAGTYFHILEFAPAGFPKAEIDAALQRAAAAHVLADYSLDNMEAKPYRKAEPIIALWSYDPLTVDQVTAWITEPDKHPGDVPAPSADPRFKSAQHEASAYRRAAYNALDFLLDGKEIGFTIDQRYPLEKPEEGGGAYVAVQLFVPTYNTDPETPERDFPDIDSSTFIAASDASDRDSAIILAAMRHYAASLHQGERYSTAAPSPPVKDVEDIATDGGEYDPPTAAEVGEIIERVLGAESAGMYDLADQEEGAACR